MPGCRRKASEDLDTGVEGSLVEVGRGNQVTGHWFVDYNDSQVPGLAARDGSKFR